MNQECLNCPVFDYRISKQIVDNQIEDTPLRRLHLGVLEHITGVKKEFYPEIEKEACIFCRLDNQAIKG